MRDVIFNTRECRSISHWVKKCPGMSTASAFFGNDIGQRYQTYKFYWTGCIGDNGNLILIKMSHNCFALSFDGVLNGHGVSKQLSFESTIGRTMRAGSARLSAMSSAGRL